MPMNIVMASAAMTTSVDAALRLSGFRNAGTPFETASTPVMAVQPFENAVRMAKVVSNPVSWGMAASSGMATIPPVRYRQAPTPSSAMMLTMKK